MKNFTSLQKRVFFNVFLILVNIIIPVSGYCHTNSCLPPPSNDECSGAIFITPTISDLYVTYNNLSSTPSVGIPVPGCADYIEGDVWFAVIVNLSGHLIFDSKAGTMTDGGMAIYSGSCIGLTLLACNDNKAPTATTSGFAPNALMPQIDKIGLPIFDTVYIRFWGKGSNNFGSFQLSVVYSPSQPPCFNLGFENDYYGWFASLGQQYQGATGAGTPVYVPLSFNNTLHPSFNIVTSGNDVYGGFPKVYSGTKSLLIGDTLLMETYDGASIEQSFTVGENTNFIYHYAIVLQQPPHNYNEQPFFKIDLFDQNGNPISCGIYSVALPNAAFTQSSQGFLVYYKPWTTISINLSAYINQIVAIRFTVSDCSQGGHWGYAYLDCSCEPFEIISSSDTICAGFNDTLYAPPGALSYLWTPGGDTTQSIVVNPIVSTTYYCNVTTQGNTPCSSTISKTIFIDNDFTSLANSNSPVCPGDTILLSSTPPGMSSYQWTGPNGFIDSIQNTFIPDIAFTDTGAYIVSIKNDRGCYSKDTVRIYLYALPSIITTNGSACIGDTAKLSSAGGISYVWSSGDSVATIYVSPLNTSTYYVKVTDMNGCIDTSSAIAIINSLPVIKFIGNTSICMGDSTMLTASGGVSYLWDNTYASQSITVRPSCLTSYEVIVIDGNGCSDSSDISVNVFPLPVPLITLDADTICKGAYTRIIAEGGTMYHWNTGESTASIIVNPLMETIYTVTISSLINNLVCNKTIDVLQHVRNCNVIYIPNSFSPSGYNTVFKPIGEIVISKTYHFAIYNRWGQMLFETTNINQGWDGRYNGEYVPSGVYIYYLNIDNGYEDAFRKIGSVTVLQ
ncbi:MAG: gliding motility-associated C-terminal domain-containing protein [Bacteroidales bacterium]